jgi:hypothetical protein
LYPIRVKDFTEFAVNYDKWDICDPCSLGQELEVPVYKFVKEGLTRKFGEDWYMELEKIAQERGDNFKLINIFFFTVKPYVSRYFRHFAKLKMLYGLLNKYQNRSFFILLKL